MVHSKVMQAYPRSDRRRTRKSYAIAAVVQSTAAPGDPIDRTLQQRDQRQRQKTVGNGLALRHLARGAVDINVDPVIIAGERRERIEPRQC